MRFCCNFFKFSASEFELGNVFLVRNFLVNFSFIQLAEFEVNTVSALYICEVLNVREGSLNLDNFE
jgi:hypothetical protein